MKEYNPEYYEKNKKKILKYRKSRREKDNLNWINWKKKKKDEERILKIKSGNIYKPINPYS